jgi:hypothetical protein
MKYGGKMLIISFIAKLLGLLCFSVFCTLLLLIMALMFKAAWNTRKTVKKTGNIKFTEKDVFVVLLEYYTNKLDKVAVDCGLNGKMIKKECKNIEEATMAAERGMLHILNLKEKNDGQDTVLMGVRIYKEVAVVYDAKGLVDNA